MHTIVLVRKRRFHRASAMRLEEVAALQGHEELRVWHIAWSPSGATLASCGEDKTIRLWGRHGATEQDGGGWCCQAVLEEGHQRTIRCVAWSPDARFLASCSFDGTASVWECIENEFDCVASLEGHENEVKGVAWAASGSLLATCGRDKAVFIWEAEDENFEVAAVMHSHTQDVKCVAWHPHEDILASSSYDDTIRLYSRALGDDDWRCTSTLSGHTSTVWCVCFTADGRGILSASDDRSIILWEKQGELYSEAARLSEVHERAIYTLSWTGSTAHGLVAAGSSDDAISISQVALSSTNNPASLRKDGIQPSAHQGDVNCVAWRPLPEDQQDAASMVGRVVASAGDDGIVRLWRCVEGEASDTMHLD